VLPLLGSRGGSLRLEAVAEREQAKGSGADPAPEARGRSRAKAMAVAPRPMRYQAPRSANQCWIARTRARRSTGLERPQAADQDHEDHVGGPLHAEDRLSLDEQRVGQGERAGRAAADAARRTARSLLVSTRTPSDAAASSSSRIAWSAAPVGCGGRGRRGRAAGRRSRGSASRCTLGGRRANRC